MLQYLSVGHHIQLLPNSIISNPFFDIEQSDTWVLREPFNLFYRLSPEAGSHSVTGKVKSAPPVKLESDTDTDIIQILSQSSSRSRTISLLSSSPAPSTITSNSQISRSSWPPADDEVIIISDSDIEKLPLPPVPPIQGKRKRPTVKTEDPIDPTSDTDLEQSAPKRRKSKKRSRSAKTTDSAPSIHITRELKTRQIVTITDIPHSWDVGRDSKTIEVAYLLDLSTDPRLFEKLSKGASTHSMTSLIRHEV